MTHDSNECDWCHGPLSQLKRRSPNRAYCSGECRSAAWNARNPGKAAARASAHYHNIVAPKVKEAKPPCTFCGARLPPRHTLACARPECKSALRQQRCERDQDTRRRNRKCVECHGPVPPKRAKLCGSIDCLQCSAARKQRNFKSQYRERTGKNYRPESNKAGEARRRSRIKSGVIEKFSPIEIYKRDNWICGLCHLPVDQSLAWPDKQSATLDHIIPVRHGGHHTRANVQLAHFACNAAKRDRMPTAGEYPGPSVAA